MNFFGKKQTVTYLIILIIGVIIASVIFISLSSINVIENTNNIISKNNTTLNDEQKLISQSIHFETDLKGYLLTNNEDFFKYSTESNNNFIATITALKKQNTNSPKTLALLDSLKQLITNRTAENEKIIAAVKTKKITPQQIAQHLQNGIIFLTTLKSIGSNLASTQKNELLTAQLVNSNDIYSLKLTSYSTVIIVVILILLIIVNLQREINNQKKLNAELTYMGVIANESNDALVVYDLDYKIIVWNKGAERITGYSAAEMIGNSLLNFKILLFTPEQNKENRKRTLETGSFIGEVPFITKNNQQGLALASTSVIKNNENKVTQFVVIAKDITDQKKVDEKLKLLANAIDQSNEAIILLDEQRNIVDWNKGAEKIYGYTKAEAIGQNSWELLSKNGKIVFTKEKEIEYKNIGYFEHDNIHQKKDGSPINVHVSITYITNSNSKEKFIAIISDITEKKKNETDLQHFGSAIEQTNEAIIMIARDMTILRWNKGAEKMYGYTKEEVVGKNFDIIFLSDASKFTEYEIELYKQQGFYSFENVHKRRDGKLITIICKTSYLFKKTGEIDAFIGVITDITESRKTEERLKLLSAMLNITEDAFYITDKIGTILHWYKSAEKFYGYTKQEAVGKNVLSLLHIYNPAIDIHHFDYSRSSFVRKEEYQINKKGIKIFVEVSLSYIINKTGKAYFLAIATDISEKKKSEEQITLLGKILQNSNEAIITINNGLYITSWNKGAQKLYGYTAEEAINQYEPIFLPTDPQASIDIANKIKDYAIGSSWFGECEHYKKDSTKFLVSLSITIIQNPYTNQKEYSCIITDITERKKEEEKTKQLANIFANAADSIQLLDIDMKIVGWNKGAQKMYGYTERDVKGKLSHSVVCADKPIFTKEVFEANKHIGYWSGENVHKRRNGEYFPVQLSITFLKDADSNYTGFICTVIDISVRKKLEYQLKDMNAVLEKEVEEKTAEITEVFERITDGFMALDNNKRLTYVNNKIGEILHKDPNEITGKTIVEIIPNIDKSLLKAYEKAVKEQRNISIEDYFTNFNAWMFVSMYPSPKGVSIFLQDVSAQKQAQEELTKMNYRLKSLSSHIQNAHEEEKAYMAREIHDELGQLTTALKIDVSWLKNKISPLNPSPEIVTHLEDMVGVLGEMVNTIRRISLELRPSILDNLGLAAAIDWHIKEFEKRTGISCSFTNLMPEKESITNVVKINLFRICQESFTNIMRHSDATKVVCELKKIDHTITLDISDNGKGFDMNQKTKSFGLLGIQERASMINGYTTIKSAPNKGTIIHTEIKI